MSEEQWGPWIEHDGKGCPCVGATCHVIFRVSWIWPDKIVMAGAECTQKGINPNGLGSAWVWHAGGSSDEIIRYRIRKPRGLTILESLLTDLPEKVDA